MRSSLVVLSSMVLLLSPLAVAHGDHHDEEEKLILYGLFSDLQERDFDLVPYDPMKDWSSPFLCGPNSLVPEPLADCQSITFSLENLARKPIAFESEPIKARFWLSADALLVPGDVPVPPPVEDVGAAPMVKVEALLTFSGQSVTKELTKDIKTDPDGKPTEFEFKFDSTVKEILPATPLELTFHWYQVDAAGQRTGQTTFNVHEGGDYTTRLELPAHVSPMEFLFATERVPLNQWCTTPESFTPQHVHSPLFQKACKGGAQSENVLAIQLLADSPFENPTVDPVQVFLLFDGPQHPQILLGPHKLVESGTLLLGYTWDYEAESADPTQYSVQAVYDSEVAGSLNQLVAPLNLESKSVPAPSAWMLVMGVVGLLAWLGGTRRED